MTGNIGLIVLNLVLFAMLVLGWQLWRQSVPKKRKVNTAAVADWPSGAVAVADAPPVAVNANSVAHDQVAYHQAPQSAPVPQLVGADASAGNVGFAPPDSSAISSQQVPSQQDVPQVDVAIDTPSSLAAPTEAPVPVEAIDDNELAALLDAAPPTAVAPVPAVVQAQATPVAPSAPASSSSLFSSPVPAATAPVSSLAPPMMDAPAPPVPYDTAVGHTAVGHTAVAGAASGNTALGDDVSQQVSALLAAPNPPAQPAPAAVPASSLPPIPSSAGSSDRLQLDITGRPVDDVMRSLTTRLGEMGYSATSGPSGETVFQRGASESIRIAASAPEMTSTDANGRPLPGRADIEVVGGQLQETTEAVLFELIDHGFQLRWAVAGELVLSSFDGALARVNVNPTASA